MKIHKTFRIEESLLFLLKEIAIDMNLSIETIRYFNRKYIKNVKI